MVVGLNVPRTTGRDSIQATSRRAVDCLLKAHTSWRRPIPGTPERKVARKPLLSALRLHALPAPPPLPAPPDGPGRWAASPLSGAAGAAA